MIISPGSDNDFGFSNDSERLEALIHSVRNMVDRLKKCENEIFTVRTRISNMEIEIGMAIEKIEKFLANSKTKN